jgi:dTDP-glucose 4,6-dehydratase
MPEAAPPSVQALLASRRRILVTGGAVLRRLLTESDALVFNLDKCGYASDLTSIEALPEAAESHVDRSIEGPAAYGSTSSPDCVTIASSVSGTFHLLQAVRSHWEQLPRAAGGLPLPPHQHR